MKPILDPHEGLRVAFKDCNNLRIGLLQHADGLGYPFGPHCQPRAVMGGAEEHNAASRVQDAS